ncbi:MAG: type II toxin-antitoxin system death-on-curing family toxin [Oscillospiraceae bacterium]|nr:type II toxin-antitoxin system death-on-curing family toxin [Oscillospiraceae bacterium]
MKKLTVEQVIALHEIMVEYSGGSYGVRDMGLLESALATPFSTFGGFQCFPTIESKAARLAFGIINNHPFIDGNKRAGIHSMLAFLELNKIKLNCNDDELIKLGWGVAAGSINEEEILDFIVTHN